MSTTRDRSIVPAYGELLHEIDRWFSRAFETHAAAVRCGRGCDRCCRGLFDISPLDAALIAEGVRAAAPAVQFTLAAAARERLREVARIEPHWTAPYRVGELGIDRLDALCDALPELPCPALAADGSCLLYAHRPLVCRAHGLPMFDPGEGSALGGACDLNDVAEADAVNDPVLHFDHRAFESRELSLMADLAGSSAADDPESHGTLIAAAILDALASGSHG